MPGRSFPLATLLGALALAGCGGVSGVRDPFNKGVALYSQGRYDEAVAEYRFALRDDPKDLAAAFNLGATFEAKADRIIEDAKRSARILRGRGSPEEAEAALSESHAEALDLTEQAAIQYRRILEIDPGFTRAGINLAAIAYRRGEEAEAFATLREIVSASPDSAAARSALGHLLIREGRNEEARTILEGARRIDRTDPDVNMALGLLDRSEGRFDAARASFEGVLAREDTHLGAILALARLELDARNLEAARSWFLRARYVSPRLYEVQFRLAEIAELDGRLEDAVSGYWAARDLEVGRPSHMEDADIDARLIGLYRKLLEQAEGAPERSEGGAGGPVIEDGQ